MRNELRRRILLDILGDLSAKDICKLYYYMIYYCIKKELNGFLIFDIDYDNLINKLSSYHINDSSYLTGNYFDNEPLFGNILKDINLKKINKKYLSVEYTINEDGLIFNFMYKKEE